MRSEDDMTLENTKSDDTSRAQLLDDLPDELAPLAAQLGDDADFLAQRYPAPQPRPVTVVDSKKSPSVLQRTTYVAGSTVALVLIALGAWIAGSALRDQAPPDDVARATDEDAAGADRAARRQIDSPADPVTADDSSTGLKSDAAVANEVDRPATTQSVPQLSRVEQEALNDLLETGTTAATVQTSWEF